MNLIDLHCDTLWYLMDLGGRGDLKYNNGSIHIDAMKKGQTKAQFFACFTDVMESMSSDGVSGTEQGYDRSYQKVQDMISYLEEQINLYQEEIAIAHTLNEMIQNQLDGKISAFLTVEEGGILNGDISRLDELYQKGVRLMTLLWNYENCIGYPNRRDDQIMTKGLKPFGVEVVRKMSKMGMIIDVSHASDGTFWDILHHAGESGGMVIASHSNCRALCGHPRNLSDRMICALAEQGGVAGLNFYGPFLDDLAPQESRISAMAKHILHMIDVGGSDFPAIGTDFDGFDGMRKMDISDVSGMGRLWEALKKEKVTEDQLDKIWHKNAERILKRL